SRHVIPDGLLRDVNAFAEAGDGDDAFVKMSAADLRGNLFFPGPSAEGSRNREDENDQCGDSERGRDEERRNLFILCQRRDQKAGDHVDTDPRTESDEKEDERVRMRIVEGLPKPAPT